jgi:DNA-directed RNA polymerase sigma subunit (sigma70/sigma32)
MKKRYRRPLSLSQLMYEPFFKPRLLIDEDPGRIEQVRTAILELDPIDAHIVRARFGIDAMPQTLKTLGRQLGMSKQAVKSREERALTRLKKMLGAMMAEN